MEANTSHQKHVCLQQLVHKLISTSIGELKSKNGPTLVRDKNVAQNTRPSLHVWRAWAYHTQKWLLDALAVSCQPQRDQWQCNMGWYKMRSWYTSQICW